MSSTKPDDPFFFLIDCNQFFVSCEKVFNPRLDQKPVVVLSNNDGCVIARSKEAKALSIPMGAPAFEYARLFKEKEVVVFSSNFSLYGDMSHRVMSVLAQFSCDMEEYSIDEAFLLMACDNPLEKAAAIKKRVLQWTGIPVSIGIGKTKTLAKVASDLAKKEATGIFFLETQEAIDRTLKTLPVREIWGIGKHLEEKLHRYGIHTSLEFKNANDGWLKKIFSVTVYKTALELRSIPCLTLETMPAAKQSITCSRSFSRPVTDLESLNEALSSYTASAAEKLRAQDSDALFLSVFLATSSFIQNAYSNSMGVSLPEPSQHTPLLISYAKDALKHLYREGYQYKKVGVVLSNLVPSNCCQMDLFGETAQQKEKKKRMMRLLDTVNQRLGDDTLQLAAEGLDKPWKSKRENTSQHFTTSWDELLTINSS